MKVLPIWALGALVLASVCAHAAPAPVAQYEFNGTLASSVGGAPALTVTDPLGLSGFGVDNVLGNLQTVWNFNGAAFPVANQAGLTFNAAGMISNSNVYSVEMLFKFTDSVNRWRRILDVENRQSDNGFYVDPANNLNIYPVAGGAAFTNDVYHDVFLVNNGGVVTFYLDGSAQATVTTNVMNLDASQTMNFFLDNVIGGGQAEYSSGSIALIRIYDEALTAPPPPVPEPASVIMMLTGLGVFAAVVRRRRPS